MRLVALCAFAHTGFGCLAQRPEPSYTNARQPADPHGLAGDLGIKKANFRLAWVAAWTLTSELA